jgi:uroporphyrinogen-III synthase
MTRVLVLRPQPGAGATARQARQCGLDAVAIPLFEIEPVPWQPPEPNGFDVLLLTSANAVRFGGEQLQQLRDLKVYAVGEATAEAAREAGFDVAASGDSGIDQLLGSIDADLKLLHLCGKDRRVPQGARQPITSVIVYRSKAIDQPDLRHLADAVVLIHSPRAGRRFAELVSDRQAITIAAISRDAALAAGDGWKAVQVAGKPTDDALLALAASLCNNPAPK